jgi:UDP-GlcNAc:undecaprenyl-phosphate GlcNAc-1-phosphate transferase
VCFGVLSWVIARSRRREPQRDRCFHQTHSGDVPRVGGVGIALAFYVGATALVGFSPEVATLRNYVTLVLGPLLMFGVGYWDDLKALGARIKLLLQVFVAVFIVFQGLEVKAVSTPFSVAGLELGVFGFLLAIFWIVALTNLINIIDGIDGLAGGISLMLMVLLINVAGAGSGMFVVLLAVIASGALVGFLYFNFPPAKIYMGDGGAYFLGCLIAVLSIESSQKGTVMAALLAPIFALGLPIIDVSLALIRRALKGLPVFRADRRHLHHRLADKGFSRRRSVLTLYVMSLLFLVMALGVFWSQGKLVPIFSGFLFLAVIYVVHSFGMVPERYSVRLLWCELSSMRRETRYVMALGHWLELEAERCASPEELWDNFQFLARKMDLYEVRLKVEQGELVWRNFDKYGRPLGSTRTMHVPIHSDTVRGIDIIAEEALNSQKAFELKAELITEAWVKAANRWRRTNGQEFRFENVTEAQAGLGATALPTAPPA